MNLPMPNIMKALEIYLVLDLTRTQMSLKKMDHLSRNMLSTMGSKERRLKKKKKKLRRE